MLSSFVHERIQHVSVSGLLLVIKINRKSLSSFFFKTHFSFHFLGFGIFNVKFTAAKLGDSPMNYWNIRAFVICVFAQQRNCKHLKSLHSRVSPAAAKARSRTNRQELTPAMLPVSYSKFIKIRLSIKDTNSGSTTI